MVIVPPLTSAETRGEVTKFGAAGNGPRSVDWARRGWVHAAAAPAAVRVLRKVRRVGIGASDQDSRSRGLNRASAAG